MSYTIPTTEPTKIYKTTTLQWTKDLADYPATTWTLTYYFRHVTSSNNFSIVATASGSTHSVSVAAASVTYTAGTYRWFAKVASGSESHFVDGLTGEVEVLADPAQTATVRTLTHAQTALANIKAVIEGTASTDAQSYSIAGRSLSRYSIKELLEMKNYYEAEVNKEQRLEAIGRGEKPKNRILVNLSEG